jgi:hypothetical protein
MRANSGRDARYRRARTAGGTTASRRSDGHRSSRENTDSTASNSRAHKAKGNVKRMHDNHGLVSARSREGIAGPDSQDQRSCDGDAEGDADGRLDPGSHDALPHLQRQRVARIERQRNPGSSRQAGPDVVSLHPGYSLNAHHPSYPPRAPRLAAAPTATPPGAAHLPSLFSPPAASFPPLRRALRTPVHRAPATASAR